MSFWLSFQKVWRPKTGARDRFPNETDSPRSVSMTALGTRLSRVILLVRDLRRGVSFYRDGLDLNVEAADTSFARLAAGTDVALELMSAEG